MSSASSQPSRRLVILLAGTLAVLELVALTGVAPGPHARLAPADADPLVGGAFAATFLLHVLARPGLVETGITILLAAAIQLLGLTASSVVDLRSAMGIVGVGLGEASLVVLAAKAALRRGDERRELARAAVEALVFPLLGLVVRSALDVSIALHPTTFDTAAAFVDAALLGAQATAPARAAAAIPALRGLAGLVQASAFLAMGAVVVHDRRAGRRPLFGLLEAVLTAAALGLALAQACPIRGAFHFAGEHYRVVADRIGTPSAVVVWALLLFWHARGGSPKARALTAVWLALTALAALALGIAGVVDLLLAPAIAAAVAALGARAVPWSRAERRAPLLVGAAITLGWIVLIRGGAALAAHRAAVWALAATTIAVPLVLHGRLADHAATRPAEEAPEEPVLARSEQAGLARALALVFFCSGAAGLVYEVVFGKRLALTFGSTAQAASTVLATYMGGMALGSWAGGRFGARREDALRVYALCEIGVGIWCALSPLSFSAVRAAYVLLAAGLPPGHPGLGALQFVLGGAVMLPATFLMGVTMPVLTRRFLAADTGLGRAVGLLYGANTLGAAVGALVTGYVLLPTLGVLRATLVAVALNLVAALAGLRLAGRRDARPREEAAAPAIEPARNVGEARLARPIALAILLGGGAVTLALEVTYTHLLAVVAGNSVYAFSLMLFAFLLGLGLGSAAQRRLARGAEAGLAMVGALEIGLAVAILAGVFVWDRIPGYFDSFAEAPWMAATFGQRELVRFAVCCLAMVPPAIFIGALYPAAIELASRAHPRGPVVGVGRAAALNTAGNITGAVAASFLLLPRLGSLATLHALAALAAALGLLVLLAPAGRRPLVPGLAAFAAALYLLQPESFDLNRLVSGANVYFEGVFRGEVIDHAESVSGGLTTVSEMMGDEGRVVRTLLTNGKFQGDDSPRRQVRAQYGFALGPLLHTDKRDRALVIGFGVGGTARALRDAGFARTDVAELSEDVLRLSAKHFRAINDDVLSDPSLHAYLTDGRNMLLLQPSTYDLVTIEVSSIWFAGAASLYDRELYQLVKRRLRPAGVMQQWVQLHHIAPRDLVTILATVRAELPHVWVYVIGAQGMIVACVEDCAPRAEAIAVLDAAPRLRPVIDLFGGSARELRSQELLDPSEVDALIADFSRSTGVAREDLVSTDDNMYLEYATPRGNVLPESLSRESNLRMLASHRRGARR